MDSTVQSSCSSIAGTQLEASVSDTKHAGHNISWGIWHLQSSKSRETALLKIPCLIELINLVAFQTQIQLIYPWMSLKQLTYYHAGWQWGNTEHASTLTRQWLELSTVKSARQKTEETILFFIVLKHVKKTVYIVYSSLAQNTTSEKFGHYKSPSCTQSHHWVNEIPV